MTGDSIQSKVSSKAYLDNYDAIFGSKNQKTKQKSVTELNWDGDEDNTEDEIPSNSFRPG